MSTTARYEAYCDHCRAGVISRDSLVLTGTERLCTRCCMAREATLQRVQRLSGRLLLGCAVVGGVIGHVVFPFVGIFPGVIVGLIIAAIIEGRMKRY